jgi:D-alanyl-D-alanine carboxypeptidase
MKKVCRRIAISVLCLVILNSCKKNENDPQPNKSEIISDSLGVLISNLELQIGKTIPSLSVYIQTSNEKIFATASSSGQPELTAQTFFRFASNSKNFTSTAILNMYEDEWLDIYDFIVDTIPGKISTYVPTTDNWNIPFKNQIAIEQLLQHSAGVYDVDNDVVPNCNGCSYVENTFVNNPQHQFSVDELVEQLTINNLSYWEPGFSHHYSNTGYSILSEIIARVYSEHAGSAKTFKNYLYDYVTGPNTKVPLEIVFPCMANDISLPDPYVSGNIFFPAEYGGDTKYTESNMSAHVAEGNGYGNFIDLNTYIRTLISGDNVLNPETVTLMQTDFSPDTSGQSNYGLGCIKFTNIGFGHNGCIRGYLSLMVYDPVYDVSMIVMMNAVDFQSEEGFFSTFITMYKAGWKARELLGFPGSPE